MNSLNTLNESFISTINPLNFTPPPEIWIRATRPPFRHKVAQNTTQILNQNDDNFLHILTAPSFIASSLDNSTLFAAKNRLNITHFNFPTTITPTTAAPLLKCTPHCEMEGICIKQSDFINACLCPEGLLGLNCNIQNPCAK